MIISKDNLESSRRAVKLHDSNMISIRQSIDDQCLEILFENHYTDEITRSLLRFTGLVFFECTNYLPWNNGHEVDCLYFEEPVLFERLREVAQEFGESYDNNLPTDENPYIQPVISFISGDRLRILCEEVEAIVEPL